jgi:hypothetical protein
MSVLKPSFFPLSPACGLLSLSAPTFASNAYSLALPPGHIHGLCRELFHKQGDGAALRAATSRSRAAAHLSPEMLGHIVGLAITGAHEARVKECLGELGVTTNRINGEWTGVSFARFQRLVKLVGGVWREETYVRGGTSLLMRFLWERARDKDDLLSYLLALHSHVPVLHPSFAHDTTLQAQWLKQIFTPDELGCEDTLEAAAEALLDPTTPDLAFAYSFELLAASLSSVHAFRSPIRLQRHSYKGGKEVPDCVEVVVREILELVLFDANTSTLDSQRLPPSASPELLAFLQVYVLNPKP